MIRHPTFRPAIFFVLMLAVIPVGATSTTVPAPMEKLIVLSPSTLGPAEFVPLTLPTSEVLATVEAEGVRYAARSGRRIVGVRPTFPSAALILAVAESNGWRDLAFADEIPDGEIGEVSLAALPERVRATYLVRSPGGGALRRAVELPLRPRVTKVASANWTRLAAFPLAPGMAGIIAGTHEGVMIAAGGANFPDRMPWDGGKKAYYDQIFVLHPGETAWRPAGKLPAPRAYAAVVSLADGVAVIGGENSDAVYDDVLLLRWDGQKISVADAPRLPVPITSAVATFSEGQIYLAGGFAPCAVRVSRSEFWCLDVRRPQAGWKSLPTWPGPARAMAVMAALDGAVYLMSGQQVVVDAEGKAQSNYLRDAYRFRIGGKWERLPDLPWSAVAAPSPAPITQRPARIFVLGGVDGRQVGKMPRDARVPEDILFFDIASSSWKLWPERWPESVVTAPAFLLNGQWCFASGEMMAGVRTTAVWTWRIAENP